MQFKEERVVDPLPPGWLSMQDAAIEVTKGVGQAVAKQILGRVARQAKLEVRQLHLITEAMSSRGLRRRKTLVMCMRVADVPQLIEYVKERVMYCDTLLEVFEKPKTADPTPEQIRERCAAIREQWTERERETRHVGDRVREIEVTQYHVEHVQKKWVRFS